MRRVSPIAVLVVVCTAVAAAAGAPGRFIQYPTISGDTIVFTYEGDLWSMPAAGGAPRRPTYFGAAVQAEAWTPDGKKVVFRSSHEATFRSMTRLYAVSPEGGPPEALPMDRAILCSYSPDGGTLAYNRHGLEEYYWKRYKGGRYIDLWLYDVNSRQ